MTDETCTALWAHCSLECFTSCDHDSPCPAHEAKR